LDYINNYKSKWTQYVDRIDRIRLAHVIMKHQPLGNSNPKHPLQGLLDCFVEAGMVHVA